MGAFWRHHGVALPMYEEKVRKSRWATWSRYSTAQAGNAMSQMNTKSHPTSVRAFKSVLLLSWWAGRGIADRQRPVAPLCDGHEEPVWSSPRSAVVHCQHGEAGRATERPQSTGL
jgi:hypothetical protein